MDDFTQVMDSIEQALDASNSNAAILRHIKRGFPITTAADADESSQSTSSSSISFKHDGTNTSSNEGSHSDDNNSSAFRGTFLDTLSDDELIRIVGFLGANLRRKPREKLNYVLFKSSFQRVVPALFHTLEMHDCRRLTLRPLCGVIELGRSDETKKNLLTLVTCGKYIRTLVLRSASQHQMFVTDIAIYAKVLAYLLPNVASIVCKGDDDDEMSKHTVNEIVYAFRKRLVTLKIIGRNRFYDGTYGALALTRLAKSKSLHMLPLRSFTYSGDTSGHLAPLWKTIRNLQEVNLSLATQANWAPTFDSLKTHCRKLHTVILENPLRAGPNNLVTEEDFVNLLCSYGAQLKKALVHSIRAEHARVLREACPNLRCIVVEKRNHFDRIAALGPQISSLSVRVKTASGVSEDWAALSAAIATCRSLASLTVNTKPFSTGMHEPISGACIESIFENPLVHLEHLALKVMAGWVAPELIAQATGRLKTVKIHFWYYCIPGFWRLLLQSNRGLEDIEIVDKESRKEERAAQYVDCLVDHVLDRLRNVKKFSFYGQLSQHPGDHVMRRIALKLRHREIAFAFRFRDCKHFHAEGIEKIRR